MPCAAWRAQLHTIVGAGSAGEAGGIDAANLLKPALARGDLRCIGATTLEEYRKCGPPIALSLARASADKKSNRRRVRSPGTLRKMRLWSGVSSR